MLGKRVFTGLVFVALCSQCSRQNQEPIVVIEQEPSLQALFDAFLDNDSNGRELPFAEITEAATGRRILAFDPNNDQVEAGMMQVLSEALNKTQSQFEQDNPSSLKELTESIRSALNSHFKGSSELDCDYSRTSNGKKSRSGYPDLRLVHHESGRVIYLSIKLVEHGTQDSQLRTFFFRPGSESSRVNDDANHLLASFTYNGKPQSRQIAGWQLLDLSQLQVRLAAEFQSSKRQLYQDKLIVGESYKSQK